MNTRLAVCGVALSFVVLSAAAARMEAGQAMQDPSQHAVVSSDKVMFQPIEVPGFKSGMKIAVIHGDPNAASGMYVIRLQVPAGYMFPAHWHPNTENLTVLSGDFQLGMGDKEDASKLVTYKPGTFVYIPPKMPHFGGATTETVVQLHGEAPFKIELANKMDAK
jgi:uncharacterized RmlC-like cupin family protein